MKDATVKWIISQDGLEPPLQGGIQDDVLTFQAEGNGNKLVAEGSSQGGGQAMAVAGLDPR